MDKVQAIRYQQGIPEQVEDTLVQENMLHIQINGGAYTITMCSPGFEFDLVRGILLTEDVYRDELQPPMHIISNNEAGVITGVNVIIPVDRLGPGYQTQRNLMSVTSCGLCGKTEAEQTIVGPPLDKLVNLRPEDILLFFEKMSQSQKTFQQTGGSHAAAIFTESGDCLVVREDIGRHNAVDKVIGALAMTGKLEMGACLLVSGRISYEIVSKCYRAGIPCLAAVSAPSALAVSCCKTLGLQLYGFCRNNRITCYTI